MPVETLAFNHTSKDWSAPFTAEINHIGVNPSRDLDIYPNIHTGKCIETAEGNDINSCGNMEPENPYQ